MNQIGKVSTDREGVAGAHVMAQLALDYHDQVRDLARVRRVLARFSANREEKQTFYILCQAHTSRMALHQGA